MNSFKAALGVDNDGLLRGRRGIFFGTIGDTVIVRLTAGIFYTTLLLILLDGADSVTQNLYIALSTGIQSAAGIGQVFSPLIFEKLHRKKNAVLFCKGLSYFIQIVILPAVILLPFGLTARAGLFVIATGLASFSEAVSTPARSAWHMYSLPDEVRIDYFASLNIINTVLSTAFNFLLSLFMDYFTQRGEALAGILIMRGAALFVGAWVLLMFNRAKEAPPDSADTAPRARLKDILLVPLSCKPFLLMVCVQFFNSFANSFGGNFYNAYLLEDVGISYTYMSLGTVFGIPCTILGLSFWNKQIRKHGWMPILIISTLLYALCFCCNALVTTKTPYLYLIGAVYCQLISGGTTLAIANLPYVHMPKENRTACFAFFNTAASLSAAAAAFVAQRFLNLTEGITLNIFNLSIPNGAYMCFISVAALLIDAALVLWLYRKEKNAKQI